MAPNSEYSLDIQYETLNIFTSSKHVNFSFNFVFLPKCYSSPQPLRVSQALSPSLLAAY
jgi:hypothetical protein